MTFRKLKFDNQNWEYYIGKTAIVIKYPNLKKKTINLTDFTGLSWDDLERGIAITPQMVKNYIVNNLC